MRNTVASWLDPGGVTVSHGVYEGYDTSQRAYVIAADASAGTIRIQLEPGDAPIINPAFVIGSARQSLSRVRCSAPAKRIEIGRENAGGDLVVWIEGTFAGETTLTVD